MSIDAIGNVFATRPGTDPAAAPVMTGSHIDTVRTGGRYDGNLGVLAGLEVAETLEQHGIVTERPFVVAFFTDEEGARFPPDMLGSLVFAGGMPLEVALDAVAVDDGARLGDELERIGFAGPLPCPTAVAAAPVRRTAHRAGPDPRGRGHRHRRRRGRAGHLVDRVPPSRGQSAHAGTTPMRLRHDPALVAAQIVTFVRDLTAEIGGAQVATVGRIEVTPEPGQRRAVDGDRSPSTCATPTRLRCGGGTAAWTSSSTRSPPPRGSPSNAGRSPGSSRSSSIPTMVDLVEATAHRLGHSTRRMPSGAGHDAQMLARLCPTAMVFTPSVNGLSHNIAEYTEAADLEAGANVLLQVILDQLGESKIPTDRYHRPLPMPSRTPPSEATDRPNLAFLAAGGLIVIVLGVGFLSAAAAVPRRRRSVRRPR